MGFLAVMSLVCAFGIYFFYLIYQREGVTLVVVLSVPIALLTVTMSIGLCFFNVSAAAVKWELSVSPIIGSCLSLRSPLTFISLYCFRGSFAIFAVAICGFVTNGFYLSVYTWTHVANRSLDPRYVCGIVLELFYGVFTIAIFAGTVSLDILWKDKYLVLADWLTPTQCMLTRFHADTLTRCLAII